jgi:hypothetical protein
VIDGENFFAIRETTIKHPNILKNWIKFERESVPDITCNCIIAMAAKGG